MSTKTLKVSQKPVMIQKINKEFEEFIEHLDDLLNLVNIKYNNTFTFRKKYTTLDYLYPIVYINGYYDTLLNDLNNYTNEIDKLYKEKLNNPYVSYIQTNMKVTIDGKDYVALAKHENELIKLYLYDNDNELLYNWAILHLTNENIDIEELTELITKLILGETRKIEPMLDNDVSKIYCFVIDNEGIDCFAELKYYSVLQMRMSANYHRNPKMLVFFADRNDIQFFSINDPLDRKNFDIVANYLLNNINKIVGTKQDVERQKFEKEVERYINMIRSMLNGTKETFECL